MSILEKVVVRLPTRKGELYEVPWEKLDEFVKGLQHCKGAVSVYRTMLDAIQNNPFMWCIK